MCERFFTLSVQTFLADLQPLCFLQGREFGGDRQDMRDIGPGRDPMASEYPPQKAGPDGMAEPPMRLWQMQCWELSGLLDPEALQGSLHRLVGRHDVLGMRLEPCPKPGPKLDPKPNWDRPRATLAATAGRDLPLIRIGAHDPKQSENALQQAISEWALSPAMPDQRDLLQAAVFRVTEGQHVFCLNVHSLICDAPAIASLGRELFLFYDEICGGPEAQLPAVSPVPGAAAFQDRLKRLEPDEPGSIGNESGNIAWPTPPSDTVSGPQSPAALTTTRTVAAPIFGATGADDAGPLAGWAACYFLMVSRYCDQPDPTLTLNHPGPPRTASGGERSAGAMDRWIDLNANLGDHAQFASLMQAMTRAIATGEPCAQTGGPHDGARYDRAAHDGPPTDAATLSLDRAPERPQAAGGLQITPRVGGNTPIASRLHLTIRPRGSNVGSDVELALTGDADHFTAPILERMADTCVRILQAVSANPAQPLDAIVLAAAQDIARQIAAGWNDTDYPADMDIPTLFEQMVRMHADQPALISQAGRWSYGELNDEADRLAGWLIDQGLQEGDRLGISHERGARLIILTLAALKAGLTAVPLDLRYPAARLRDLLDVARCTLVVGEGEPVEGIGENARWRPLPAWIPPKAPDIRRVTRRLGDPARPAFLTFTSGTTGKPKCIPVSHGGVVRLTHRSPLAPVGPGDRFAQLASPSFDGSYVEIWGALLSGAELAAGEGSIHANGGYAQAFRDFRPTASFLTTSVFNIIVDDHPQVFQSLKYLSVGGEAASPDHFNRLRETNPHVRLGNVYGPAENTGFTTFFLVEGAQGRSVPIGRAMPNNHVFVLSDALAPVPAGFCGEICIGGPGLTEGYLNRPEQTRAKFVTLAAGDLGVAGGGDLRLYRTGDRGRWNGADQLEFLGRKDSQFKLNGLRIEPAEIEHALVQHPSVNLAVVEPDRPQGTMSATGILAFYEPEGPAPDAADLRRHLAGLLPASILPTRYLPIRRLPLNANGKADRPKLREIAANAARDNTPTQVSADPLTAIWERLLNCAIPSEQADFFDLGGTSVCAITMVSQVEKRFGCTVDLTGFLADTSLCNLRQQIGRPGPPTTAMGRHLVGLKDGDPALGPLICLPGFTGGVLWAERLVSLWDTAHPVYGLLQETSDGVGPAATTLDDLVDRFVRDIAASFPDSEIHLAGFSIGVYFAHALAAGITRAGLKLGKVFYLDGSPYLTNFVGEGYSVLYSSAAAARKLVAQHELSPIAADIHLFRCTAEVAFPSRVAPGDWAGFTHGEVKVFDHETSHEGIVFAPSIGLVAQQMAEALNGRARPDHRHAGDPDNPVYTFRKAARTAALAGDLGRAHGLIDQACGPGGETPDWAVISKIRLFGMSDQPQEAWALVANSDPDQHGPQVWHALLEVSKRHGDRIRALQNIVRGTGPKMLGGLRLVKSLGSGPDRTEAEELARRMLASPQARIAGELAMAWLCAKKGDAKASEEWALGAIRPDTSLPARFQQAAQMMNSFGYTDLALRILRLGLERYPKHAALMQLMSNVNDD